MTTPTDTPRTDAAYLANLMEAFDKLSKRPVLVGIACSPMLKAQIDRIIKPLPEPPANAGLLASFYGVPFLIDSRMQYTFQPFYDADLWRARCREQAEYDAARRALTPQPQPEKL